MNAHLTVARLRPSSPTFALDIRIIEIARIRELEIASRDRADKLAAQIDRDGVLNNPVIVCELNNGDYALVDGHHRLAYCKDRAIPYVAAQVTELGITSQVLTWAHLLRFDPGAFLHAVTHSGLTVRPLDWRMHAHPLTTDHVVAAFAFAECPETTYVVSHDNRVAALKTFVDLYRDHGTPVRRIPFEGGDRGDSWTPGMALDTPGDQNGGNLLVIFPTFNVEDVSALAEHGDRIPSGITRLVLNPGGRVLGIRCSVEEVLRSSDTEKHSIWCAELLCRPSRRFRGPVTVVENAERREYGEDLLHIFDPDLVVEGAQLL